MERSVSLAVWSLPDHLVRCRAAVVLWAHSASLRVDRKAVGHQVDHSAARLEVAVARCVAALKAAGTVGAKVRVLLPAQLPVLAVGLGMWPSPLMAVAPVRVTVVAMAAVMVVVTVAWMEA